jgi:hypothetical protein
MLTILGRAEKKSRFCDGISRRGFLSIGGAAVGGFGLNRLLELEAAAGVGRSHKAIINIYLPGGPSHLDMWDLKPHAPVEIRGEFDPINTNVPGIQICELFPRMAAMMDKFVLIRTLADSDGAHDCYQCMTGYKKSDPGPRDGWPAAGAWVSRLAGQADPSVPAHAALMYPTGNRTWGEPGTAGFLPSSHNPFNLVGRKPGEKSDNMVLKGVTLERLRDRVQLRGALDRFRHDVEKVAKMGDVDEYLGQALDILTDSKLGDALDLSKEDPKVLERYGANDEKFQRDGAPRMVQNFCVARRLVEAGARYVTLNYSRWDWHGADGMNYPMSRVEFPMLDRGLSALVSDLHERGLDQDVSIVMWGEFGRTPRINDNNSRDHWPRLNACVLAGGGMRMGQVIGESNKYAEEPSLRPVKFQEVFATLYHNLGLDAHRDRVFDNSGVPRYPVEPEIEPLHELI